MGERILFYFPKMKHRNLVTSFQSGDCDGQDSLLYYYGMLNFVFYLFDDKFHFISGHLSLALLTIRCVVERFS